MTRSPQQQMGGVPFPEKVMSYSKGTKWLAENNPFEKGTHEAIIFETTFRTIQSRNAQVSGLSWMIVGVSLIIIGKIISLVWGGN